MARTALATQSERKHLEAHVDLCAERYDRLQEMKQMIINESQRSTKIVIGSAATVIGGLLSTVVAILLVLV